jgi:hypothetical protein
VDGGDDLRTNISPFQGLLRPASGHPFVGMPVSGEAVTGYATHDTLDAKAVGIAEMIIGSRPSGKGRPLPIGMIRRHPRCPSLV